MFAVCCQMNFPAIDLKLPETIQIWEINISNKSAYIDDSVTDLHLQNLVSLKYIKLRIPKNILLQSKVPFEWPGVSPACFTCDVEASKTGLRIWIFVHKSQINPTISSFPFIYLFILSTIKWIHPKLNNHRIYIFCSRIMHGYYFTLNIYKNSHLLEQINVQNKIEIVVHKGKFFFF